MGVITKDSTAGVHDGSACGEANRAVEPVGLATMRPSARVAADKIGVNGELDFDHTGGARPLLITTSFSTCWSSMTLPARWSSARIMTRFAERKKKRPSRVVVEGPGAALAE